VIATKVWGNNLNDVRMVQFLEVFYFSNGGHVKTVFELTDFDLLDRDLKTSSDFFSSVHDSVRALHDQDCQTESLDIDKIRKPHLAYFTDLCPSLLLKEYQTHRTPSREEITFSRSALAFSATSILTDSSVQVAAQARSQDSLS
jgi:hypothetical protein